MRSDEDTVRSEVLSKRARFSAKQAGVHSHKPPNRSTNAKRFEISHVAAFGTLIVRQAAPVRIKDSLFSLT